MELTQEELIDIRDGFNEEFQLMTGRKILDRSGWSIHYKQVFLHMDGIFIEISWEEGATELEENDDLITYKEVKPVERRVIEYV